MRGPIYAGERWSSPWLHLRQSGSSIPRVHNGQHTTRHQLHQNATGQGRPVPVPGPSISHSLFIPSKLGKHQWRLRRHVARPYHSGNNRLHASVVSAYEANRATPSGQVHRSPSADTFEEWESPQQEQEYATRFYHTLQNGQPDQVMKAMTDPRSAGLVGTLPQTVFLAALHLLSPAHFVDPVRHLHHPLHTWAVLVHGLKRIEEVFDTFVQNLFTVIGYRTTYGGQRLGLAEFTHILDCARAMGNGNLADQVWATMKETQVVPNALCYTHYMEAKIWDHCYTGAEAYRLRVQPKAYRKRRTREPKIGWQGFGTAQRSVRKLVLRLFGEMQAEGHAGDERTYINLLLAAARVGHSRAMVHILKEVWNVDVEALKQEPDDAKLPPVTNYDSWSALYPTENLLFAVAHAFGVNNDIAGAVRTVQFLSSSYKMPIPAKVWHEVFERAYVQSRERWSATETTRSERDTEWANTVGRVSVDIVQSVFVAMTSEPYNVKPTMQEWRFMVNTAIGTGSLEDCKRYINGAYDLLEETRNRQTEARKVVLRCLNPALQAARQQMRQGAPQPSPELFESPILAEAIRTYDLIRLEAWQQLYLLQRMLYVVVRTPGWKDISEKQWLLQERPRMLEEWVDFLPSKIQLLYNSNTGHIDMMGPKGFGSRSYKVDSREVPVRRHTGGKDLFDPGTWPAWTEKSKWEDLAKRYPFLDRTAAPLDRLFTFQVPQSEELYHTLSKMRDTWTEYPEDHALSTKNNPHGGFFGRLAALDMLKTEKGNSVFLLDGKSWI
ncbi:hypothetical protein N7539_003922 [Penicillium diatomitis]|uniref:Uncharacterized protein n=1 Tax=Penicillium diatomitis TaxID=2819901 RepID=A0A9W9XD00_9EURO|nr:uncharacterized protein N7539_003922 [Penicillium diatomitis]KAJ5489032.1 hypothetical protein N7539_003922 [Penicillium diatomitis]